MQSIKIHLILHQNTCDWSVCVLYMSKNSRRKLCLQDDVGKKELACENTDAVSKQQCETMPSAIFKYLKMLWALPDHGPKIWDKFYLDFWDEYFANVLATELQANPESCQKGTRSSNNKYFSTCIKLVGTNIVAVILLNNYRSINSNFNTDIISL